MTKTVLVNKENKVKDYYLKKLNLVEVNSVDLNNILIEKEAYDNFLKLQSFLLSYNLTINIKSAYIDENPYIDDITGLGILLDVSDMNNINLLYENLYKFGFILRYPKDKENETGYEFRPLYIRYVGKIVSKIIYDNSYTLEGYLNNYSGILVINKPKDITSFDVVFEVSKLLGIKRIGHTGTLDPLASGVLVLTIGKATKIGELLTCTYKEYEASVIMGVLTDTLDITGKILRKDLNYIDADIGNVVHSFRKTYLQEVPIYSAVKVNGKKLYQYARNNETVKLPVKEVDIKEIELLEQTKNSFKFKCLVSKGCYIRSLIRDMGNYINSNFTMTDLIRTKQYKYNLKDAYTLEEIRNGNFNLISIIDALDYEVIMVDDSLEFKIKNGQRLNNIYNVLDKVIFINDKNKLLGIYEKVDNELKVWKNFN